MTILPELKIQHEKVSCYESITNLNRFLYIGGARVDARHVLSLIELDGLGKPQLERLDLLWEIKEELETQLVTGFSIHSVRSRLNEIRSFFQFVDKNEYKVSIESLVEIYLEYCEYLFLEANKKAPKFKLSTAYGSAAMLSKLFGNVLDIPISTPLLKRTRLKSPKFVKKAVSKKAEKQNLEDTFKLGKFLSALIAGLTIEAIYSELPIKIPIQRGLVESDEIVLNVGTADSATNWLSSFKKEGSKAQKKRAKKLLLTRAPVSILKGSNRWGLVNLHVTAAFLVFIAQTGFNVEQARNIKLHAFKYKSVGDFWEVRSYKNRRGGEVFFKIYKSYKPILRNHFKFVKHFFPNSQLLFPTYGFGGIKESKTPIRQYAYLKRLTGKYDVPWIPPMILRNTKVNWLLRRSGDEDLTAEMAQHTKEVLRDRYELPSQQRAITEITQFWNKHDPIKKDALKASLIAGSKCDGKSEVSETKPALVVEPNCVNPSGCLWCKSHRDLNSEDYVWSLASFRYLKLIEISLTTTREKTGANFVIDNLSQKLNWFRKLDKSAKWVGEAEQRIDEGHFHPNWSNIIKFLE